MCDGHCSRSGRPAGAAPDGELRVVGTSRREFIGQATLAAVAALLTACGDGQIGGEGPTAPPVLDTDFTIRLADYPALQKVGGIARIASTASNPIAVTRTGANSFVALSLICPHAGYKPISITSSGFRCPNHNALFASDGNWIGGQRTRDLQAYPVAYDAGAGTLIIG